MTYPVHTITRVEQLEKCELFRIDRYQWSKGDRPAAFGRMGLLKDFGLILSMTAMERNPLRIFTRDDDPVFRDSGLEAFFNFAPDAPGQKYLNFEMNANGAMLSGFGSAADRRPIAGYTSLRAFCEAEIEESSWKVTLKLPMELIRCFYQIGSLQQGDSFTCNFYKICEAPGFEHYASYAPIISAVPNFHLPEFFCKAMII